MDTRFRDPQIFLVRAKPPLIGVLEGCGQGRHDLATVTEITTDLSPLLLSAHIVEAPAGFHSFLQPVEI
jgi:hypothetical protein